MSYRRDRLLPPHLCDRPCPRVCREQFVVEDPVVRDSFWITGPDDRNEALLAAISINRGFDLPRGGFRPSADVCTLSKAPLPDACRA